MALNNVYQVPGKVKINHALISVTDKTALDVLARGLVHLNPDVIVFSTGGTLKELIELLPEHRERIRTVESLTGNPEIQGGLVKTLDYKIYLGLLTEPYNAEHLTSLKAYGVPFIDLVVVNLYPFERVIQENASDIELARAHIDIGGPTMIRAAAKNYHRVLTLTDPRQYTEAIETLGQNAGCSTLAQRFQAARAAFARIAAYDRAISEYLEKTTETSLGVYRFGEDLIG